MRACAKQHWACVIFNLHVDHAPAGIEASAAALRQLIDRAIERGGSYYLTCRRFATRAQVAACHPQFRVFLRLKEARDPDGVFQSDGYRHCRALFDEPAARARPIRDVRRADNGGNWRCASIIPGTPSRAQPAVVENMQENRT